LKLRKVRRGDSPQDQTASKHHRCSPKRWAHLMTPDGTLDYSKMDSDDDVLVFAVGVYGEGMTRGAAFPVTAICPACGDDVTEWFVWS